MRTYRHVVYAVEAKWNPETQEYMVWELHPDDCPACRLPG